MVTELPFEMSEPLKQELAAIDEHWIRTSSSIETLIGNKTDCNAYLAGHSTARDTEVLEWVRRFGKHLTILEVGSGMGITALLLARLGHRLSVVDPSRINCELLDATARTFSLDIAIYRTTGEACALVGGEFDLVLFNASLHHCDDPVRALRSTRELLKHGGSVLICNEPVLPFFRSQGQFTQRLADASAQTGNYGGNEHIYSIRQYLEMLRAAGYSQLTAAPNLAYLTFRGLMNGLRDRDQELRRFVESRGGTYRSRLYLRCVYYSLQWLILKMGRVGLPGEELLMRLSMLDATFIGAAR